MHANFFPVAHRARRSSAGLRRGILSIELILVLPILLALVLAMVEFGLLLAARQQLTGASREGARVAALGGDETEVEAAARRYLGTGSLQAAEVEAVLTDSSGNPLESGDPVEVIVRIEAVRAAPDVLRFVGISIRGEIIVARTLMRKE